MHLRRVLLALGCALILPLSVAVPQEAQRAADVADIDDPEFQAIVAAGPDNSAELERVITTYAANGMDAEVTRSFAEYLLRPDLGEDRLCEYCRSLLSSIDHRSSEPTLARQVLDATEFASEEAYRNQDSALLIRLAMLAAAGDSREPRSLSLYYLVIAAQLGIDDEWRDEVMQTLVATGFYSEALGVAQAIYADPDSEHFQSEDIRPWIEYLTGEVDRNQQIASLITAAAMP